MRVIEPKTKAYNKPNKKLLKHFLYLSLIILAIIMLAVLLSHKKIKAPSDNKFQTINSSAQTEEKPGKFKSFTADEFRNLYNSFAYPNTELINDQTPITGNPKVDARIRQLAEKRGYRLQSAPVSKAFVEVSDKKQLQQRAAAAWFELEKAAKKDGIDIFITEALRYAEDQKAIFLGRLRTVSLESIAEGRSDDYVNLVLSRTAPPGYSRHHSGYTIDLDCNNQTGMLFDSTVCFDWLSKDNYLNAKKAGWIPSYPEGTKMQGPEPESWEYVWVGTVSLSE